MAEMRIHYVDGANPEKWFRVWNLRHPDAPVAAQRVAEPDQLHALLAGEVDAAIVRGPVADARLHTVGLYRENVALVVHKDHAAAAFDTVALADLAGEALIATALSATLGVPSDTSYGELDAPAAIETVATGSHVALVTQPVARLFASPEVRIRLVDDAEGPQMSLVWLRERDSDDMQDLVGIVRGRKAHSSRGETGERADADAPSRQPQRAAKQTPGKQASGKQTPAKQAASSAGKSPLRRKPPVSKPKGGKPKRDPRPHGKRKPR